MDSNYKIWGTLLKVSLGLILVLSFLQVKMKFGWDPIKEYLCNDSCGEKTPSIYIESIALLDSMEINVNETQQLLAQIEPANATNQNLKWSSSDTTVAIVDPTTGSVTATGKGGECIITAAATDDSGKSDTIKIKVKKEKSDSMIRVSTITFQNSKDEIILNPGSNFKIDAMPLPEKATNKILKWMSDKEGVATVNNGIVTGRKAGVCTITASSTDGSNVVKSIKVRVKVKEPKTDIKVSSISFDKTTLTISIGDREQIVAKILPTDATNKTLIWKSDNEGFATVDNGVVKGKGVGACTITASSTDGGNVVKSIRIRVQDVDVLDGKTIEEKVKYYLSYFSNSTNTTSKIAKAKDMDSLFAPDAKIIIKEGSVSQKETKQRIKIWASNRMKIRYISHKINTSGLIIELTVEEDLRK